MQFHSKTSKTIIAALAAVLFSINPALAATVTFIPDGGANTGSIDTFIPVDKIGTMPLPRGRVVFRGNVIEVTMIPEWQFDRQVVLRGPVLDTTISADGGQAVLRGTVFFNEGTWLPYFDSSRVVEDVATKDGELHGRITAINATTVTLAAKDGAMHQIPLRDITDIESPRAYTFKLPVVSPTVINPAQAFQASSTSLSFNSSDRPIRAAALKSQLAKGDGDWSTKRLVAIGTILSLVELGQLAPVLAVPLGSNGLRRTAFIKQLQVDAATGIP